MNILNTKWAYFIYGLLTGHVASYLIVLAAELSYIFQYLYEK